MTDSIEAGSDDDAIAGEQVAYVPCFGAAATADADDDSEAIDGRGEGYVAGGTEAGDFADSDDGQAVYGSAVGFVAKPCSEEGCTDKVIDDFTRTEVFAPFNAWGRTTPDAYGVWNTGTPIGSSSFSVNGTQGVAVGGHTTPLGSPQGTTAVLSGAFPTGSWPWEDGDFSVRVRFQFDDNGTGSPSIIFNFGNTSGYVNMYYQHGDGTVKFGIYRSGAGVGESTTFVAPVVNSMYAMEMEYKQSTGLHRGRMYLESGPVPDWQITRDSSGDSPTVSSGMRVVVEPASGSPDVTYLIEDITYDLCPECGITDTFTRTESSGWGTSDSTLDWITTASGTVPAVISTDGDKGLIVAAAVPASTSSGVAEMDYPGDATVEMYIRNVSVNWSIAPSPSGNSHQLIIFPANNLGASFADVYSIGFQFVDLGSGVQSMWRFLDASVTSFVDLTFNPNDDFDMHIIMSASQFKVRAWPSASAEPGTWDYDSVTPQAAFHAASDTFRWAVSTVNEPGVLTVAVGSLDITGVNRCTVLP